MTVQSASNFSAPPRGPADPFVKPRFGLAAHPTHSVKMAGEGVDRLNGTVRPLGFDGPPLAMTQHYAKKRTHCPVSVSTDHGTDMAQTRPACGPTAWRQSASIN
jgi:hypothetical protein